MGTESQYQKAMALSDSIGDQETRNELQALITDIENERRWWASEALDARIQAGHALKQRDRLRRQHNRETKS